MITAMEFTIKFDRKIEKDIHYITPGAYSVNGKAFDFLNYEGTIEGDKLHCVVYDFDQNFFEESAEGKKYSKLSVADFRKGFDEFFVYTGEYDDAEIVPEKILSLSVYNDGKRTTFGGKVLDSATEAIAS